MGMGMGMGGMSNMGGMPGMNGMGGMMGGGPMGMQMTGASSPGVDPRFSMAPSQFDANFGAAPAQGGQYGPGQMNRFSSFNSPAMSNSPADSSPKPHSHSPSEAHTNGVNGTRDTKTPE